MWSQYRKKQLGACGAKTALLNINSSIYATHLCAVTYSAGRNFTHIIIVPRVLCICSGKRNRKRLSTCFKWEHVLCIRLDIPTYLLKMRATRQVCTNLLWRYNWIICLWYVGYTFYYMNARKNETDSTGWLQFSYS